MCYKSDTGNTISRDQEWQPEERVKTSAQKAIEKAFTLAIPYSANIGGTAFLTGTPPNIVVKSQVETYVH